MKLEDIIDNAIFDFTSETVCTGQDNFTSLAKEVLTRLDEDDFFLVDDELYDAIYQAMNDELIYAEDQWKMLQIYCNPNDANFEEAWNSFQGELIQIAEKVREELSKETGE